MPYPDGTVLALAVGSLVSGSGEDLVLLDQLHTGVVAEEVDVSAHGGGSCRVMSGRVRCNEYRGGSNE